MEVLGAVVTITSATIRTTSAVWSLCDTWREAPEELHRLLEDLRRAQQFFREAQEGLKHPSYLKTYDKTTASAQIDKLHQLLDDGAAVVGDIGQLVSRLRKGDDGGGWEKLKLEEVGKRRRAMWLRQTWKVARLRKRLKQVTVSICQMMVAQNVAVSADIHAAVEDSKEEVMSHIGQRLEYTEDAISQLGDALYMSQKTTLLFMNKRFDSMESSLVASVRDPIREDLALLRKELSQARQPPSPKRSSPAASTRTSSPSAPLVGATPCPLTCRCRCHFTRSTTRLRTHPSLGPLLGIFALTYAGDSPSPRACSDRQCVNTRKHGVDASSRELSLTVSLPPWLLRASLTLLYTSSPRPEFLLRVFHHLPTGVPEAAHNIFGYIDRNDINGVKRLLSTRQASVHDVRYSRHVSPLYAATERKQVDMVKLLLQAGADPFQATTDGKTPLIPALQYYLSGTPEGCELVTLLPVFSTLDLSPLHLATIGILHVELSHALCKPEFLTDLNRLDLEQYTPLHLAAIRGDAAATRALLRAGAKVDLPGGNQKTPLNFACAWGHFDVAKMLLDASAEVDSRDSFGLTPLMRAASYAKTETRLLEMLVGRGAQVNARANDLSTALGHAIAYECLDAAEFLLENGADVDAKDKIGDAAIIEALVSGSHDGVRLLLQYECEIGAVNVEGMGVLHHLAAAGDEEMMEIFRQYQREVGGSSMASAVLDKGQGKTPLEIFNERESTPALREAFYRLLEGSGSDETDDDESDEEDEFVDAQEEVVEDKVLVEW